MNEWVSKLQQNSGEQNLAGRAGAWLCAVTMGVQSLLSPVNHGGQRRSSTALSLIWASSQPVSGTAVLCQEGFGGFVSIPHTQLQIRNSTTDVSGASAAKSQCQEYYNCALVFFLHLLCGVWKPLARTSGKETCNIEVFPLLCLYPRGFRPRHEILGWLVGPRAGTTAGDRRGKPCSTGMQSWGWLYEMVLCTASKMFAMPPGFPEVDYFQAAAHRVEGTSGAGG